MHSLILHQDTMSTLPCKKPAATAPLAFLALGVVFGDIGTSPLYALRETFNPNYGIPLTMDSILGGCSSIFWAMMLVVTLKYIILILRATNHGEGGIMAMLSLASSVLPKCSKRWRMVILLGFIGAALFYGEAVITPAMSVLSAVEGLTIGSPAFESSTVLIAMIIIVALFACQRLGTRRVGRYFGVVCSVWFLTIAVVGVLNIVQCPRIFLALSPHYALRFISGHGFASFLVLGSVLLAFTGAEALYADVGHFGKKSIRWAWFMVAPCLVMNYFGQGALLLREPSAVTNPFYLACPTWFLYPMVGLATLATIIASQAVISGTYSVTWQAIKLHYLPRMQVCHTSDETMGQIYIPAINWILLASVVATLLVFRQSDRLAAAYGISVSGTMLISSLLVFFVIRYDWRYSLIVTLSIVTFFVCFDAAFFCSSFLKIFHGAWFTLLVALLWLTLLLTWQRGRQVVATRRTQAEMGNLTEFLQSLLTIEPPVRVSGTAVFFCPLPNKIPTALAHNLKHNKVLHETVIFLSILEATTPYIAQNQRVSMKEIAPHCYTVQVRFGFNEEFDVPRALAFCAIPAYCHALDLSLSISYFLNDENLVINRAKGGMMYWQKVFFSLLVAAQKNVADYYHLPANQVIRLASYVEL